MMNIKRVLGKRYELGRSLEALFTRLETPIAILDLDGNIILGDQPEEGSDPLDPSPITYQGELVGWVIEGDTRDTKKSEISALIQFIYNQEVDKRALATEVLDKYRELSLLYQLADKLSSSPTVDDIAAMALNEACSLFQVVGGALFLKRDDTENPEIIAACGKTFRYRENFLAPGGLAERVLLTGVGDMVNLVDACDYFEDFESSQISIICTPLKTEKHIFGLMVLVAEGNRQFSAGDLKLLTAIAVQTAPAIEITQLHQIELEKTRLESELHLARQVQTDLLPQKMPILDGWEISAYWQPARMVSGDFYDFIRFSDGKMGLAIADVAGKGMPAALMMANTRSVLRAIALNGNSQVQRSPSSILRRTNDLLCREMPMSLFVTCLLVIFDPETGEIRFANAGHNLPYKNTHNDVIELRAVGTPLGIFPNVVYEEKSTYLDYGESLLMYSDGIPEAHNPKGEMFGYPRLRQYLAEKTNGSSLYGDALIRYLMDKLTDFTGADMGLEDDVTIVTLKRMQKVPEFSFS